MAGAPRRAERSRRIWCDKPALLRRNPGTQRVAGNALAECVRHVWPKDREVKAFLDSLKDNRLTIEETFVGKAAKASREQGTFKAGGGIGDAAIAEFMASGVQKYLAGNEPVLLLFEDSDFRNLRFVRKPDNLHMLSTVAMLRGMERVGIIASADDVIEAMTKPEPPKRARAFKDLPDGYEDEAIGGSVWKPGPHEHPRRA